LGRKPRFEFPGGVYHVIQRGNNREFIFEAKEDKEYLLSLISKYIEKMHFRLYGYVIMGNHYHLIIKTSEISLSVLMQRINNKFSRYYNRKNKRTGHVFENRYKGILVIDNRYLLSLLRYVHQNPISAKMCENVADYPWSSDHCYRENNGKGMVHIDFILNIFSENRRDALIAYIHFMDENKKEDIAAFEEVDVIGRINLNVLDDYCKIEKKSLEDILIEVIQDKEIVEQIKSGSRRRNLMPYKKEFIQQALKYNYTMQEIGKSISISHVAVHYIINHSE